MPVVGWICPNTREKVPFGHFDICAHGIKGRPAYSPFYAALDEDKIRKDVRHSTLDITITQVLDCPRAIYLDRTRDYHVDPSSRAAMVRGTACHSQMAKILSPELYYTEGNDPIRLDVRGVLFGQPISAMLDILRKDGSEIIDAKFPKDWSARYRDKTGKVKLEHAIQLNGQRLLLAQQDWAIKEGYDPETVRLTIWDHALGGTEGPLAMHAPIMTEEEMATEYPWRSAKYSVQDNVNILVAVREEHEKLASGDKVAQEKLAASIPMVGETQMFGDSPKCKFCSLKKECDGLVMKYGRPE